MEADRRGAQPETLGEGALDNINKIEYIIVQANFLPGFVKEKLDVIPESERARVLSKAAKQKKDNAESYTKLRDYLEKQGYWGSVTDLDEVFEKFHIDTNWQTARAKLASIVYDQFKHKGDQ